jgi:cytoskeletal protein CcmA (bactofilin family)
MNHFDEMACMLYLDGQLEADRSRDLLLHAGECAACGTLLRALEKESGWMRAAMAEESEPVPARVMAAPARAHTPWGWIAAFGLAIGGAYTLWDGLIAPWQQQISNAGLNSNNLLTILVFRGAFWKGWDSMRNLGEFITLAVLLAVVGWFTRRNWRSRTGAGMVLGGVICALSLMPAASAGTPQSSAENSPSSITLTAQNQAGPVPSVEVTIHGVEEYTLPADETLHSDAIISANFAHIDGTVQGDVIALVQDMSITGHVEGDVIVFARSLRITGQVDGNVRSYSQFTTISGNIGRNVTAGCETFQLDPGGKIGWGLILGANDAILSGAIGRNLLAGTKSTEIDGTVGGNVTLALQRATIGPRAEILGTTKIRGGEQPQISPTAKLGSPVQFKYAHEKTRYRGHRFYAHRVLLWGAAFVLGLVLLALFPTMFDRITRAGRQSVSLIGILVLFGVPIVSVIACITLVGIPLAILTIFLYIAALYSAQIFVGEIIGETLMGRAVSFGALLGRMALGLLIIQGLAMIPYVGGWFTLIVLVWGIGAISVALFRNFRRAVAVS